MQIIQQLFLYFIMRINYVTKKVRQPLEKSNIDQQALLSHYILKKIGHEPIGVIPSSLNVSVNGKNITKHMSPIRYRSLEVSGGRKIFSDQFQMMRKKFKNLPISSSISQKSLINPQDIQSSRKQIHDSPSNRLVQLRKMFKEKFRNKTFSDQKQLQPELTIKSKEITQVENRSLYSYNRIASSPFSQERQRKINEKRIKYPYARKNKPLKSGTFYRQRCGENYEKKDEKRGNLANFGGSPDSPIKLCPWEVFQ